MSEIDFDKFKKEEFVVNCTTEKSAYEFLGLCREQGFINDEDYYERLSKAIKRYGQDICFHYNNKSGIFKLHYATIKTYADYYLKFNIIKY